jgi:hypothetical protein
VPVDEAEHKLQVLSDARSPAALQFLGYASAAQRASGVRRLVPPVLLRLLQPEDRLALGEGERTPSWTASGSSPASARTSPRKDSMRWSIGFARCTACQLRG